MSSTPQSYKPTGNRIFVGRLVGTNVFDPIGDPLGHVCDVVAVLRFGSLPDVVGLVLEVSGHRRVFLPVTRIMSIQPGQVIISGMINIRQFRARAAETTVMGELMDRIVPLRDGSGRVKILDVAMEQDNLRNWRITQLFVEKQLPASTFSLSRKGGETMLISPRDVTQLRMSVGTQEASTLLAQLASAKAADIAEVLAELPEARRIEVAQQFSDEKLADILEELGDEDRVAIMSALDLRRAGDVLDVMQPDDAADLVREMPQDQAQVLLAQMEPDEAEDVRRLLEYDDFSAGGLMTTTPVILEPDANVATMLAHVRRSDIPPALAAIVFIARPPTETPTGKYLGAVHIQRALREPPQTMLGQIMDSEIEGVSPDAGIGTVTRLLATYNLTALPVIGEGRRMLGAISVDDVLDHLLPDDWRGADNDETDQMINEFTERNLDG